MHHLGEAFRRLATNALAGRIRGNQLGMRSLQPLQFLHQPIELGVREFWGIENVVKMFVIADCLAQLIDLALHSPIFHAIPGGSSHGLIIFRRAVEVSADALQRSAKGWAGTVTCAFTDPMVPLVPSLTANRNRYFPGGRSTFNSHGKKLDLILARASGFNAAFVLVPSVFTGFSMLVGENARTAQLT